MKFDKDVETMVKGMMKMIHALEELGFPFVLGIQTHIERKAEINEGFPGMIAYHCPANSDFSFMPAAMFLKEGFANGMTALGFPMEAVGKYEGERRLAELEQGDAKAKISSFPMTYTNMAKKTP